MRNQKLFALTGSVRGAARLVYGESGGGTLAVELSPRGTGDYGEYDAWLAAPSEPLLRASLGPAMTAAMPAAAINASGLFISREGKIIASGSSGLSRADMESAALRVQLSLAHDTKAAETKRSAEEKSAGIPEVVQKEAQPVSVAEPKEPPQSAQSAGNDGRATIPANRASGSPFSGMPDGWQKQLRDERAERLVREASVGPELRSRAAMTISTTASRLFSPTDADYAESAFIEQGANTRMPRAGNANQGIKRSMANAGKPVPPAQKNGVYPPAGGMCRRTPRGRFGKPR